MTTPSAPTTGARSLPSRRSDLWSLDEYIVVADLYLRRGRSSGISDPDVIALAELTGRTPASISRRLGNFDGTARPGMGLKPVLGEAREVFLRMQDDPRVREQLTREARNRLSTNSGSARTAAATRPRLVDPEEFQIDRAEVTTLASTRELRRLEAQLVRRYRSWLDPAGQRLRGLVIPTPEATLRADLFDIGLNLLIEAKGAVTREHIRYGVGQLLDYRRYVVPRPDMALLLPIRLPGYLVDLPAMAGVDVIWEQGNQFVDSRGGMLTPRA